MPHPIFSYLGGAIQSHLERYPDDSGFNEIEKEILNTISGRIIDNVDTLVRHMLQWQDYYGFGDLQYYYYIKSLSPFIDFGETIRLSHDGEKYLKTRLKRSLFPSLDLPFGGGSASQYYRAGGKLSRIIN